jgi:hypothetical protein
VLTVVSAPPILPTVGAFGATVSTFIEMVELTTEPVVIVFVKVTAPVLEVGALELFTRKPVEVPFAKFPLP